MPEKKALVSMKFKSTLADEELRSIATYRKEQLKNTKGLLSLICHHNPENKLIGGTFIFKTIAYAQQYVDQFLLEGHPVKYGVIPNSLKIEIDELEEIIQLHQP